MRLHEMRSRAPFTPLLVKELREIAAGRALWTMLLLLCPLVGFSFIQAVDLYGAASASALQSSSASDLSPLDGILVPTFGSLYVGVTLLFPFVAIRVLGHEKEKGALRLLVQLPYRPATLAAAKLAAVQGAWIVALVPAVSALALWLLAGGHLHPQETANLVLGHLLYGLLIAAIALFAASISDSGATAAIMTLAVTIGSWMLDFAAAGQSGVMGALARLSLTQMLRPFEQGLLSPSLVIAMLSAAVGFTALTAIWLPPGVPVRSKFFRSVIPVAALVMILGFAASIQSARDVTEDQRNSFPPADQRVLATLTAPLLITVHLASEDPRYVDFRRNVLAKLQRAMPDVTINLATDRHDSNADSYGEINYAYASRSDTSRSTSAREVLPLLYALAGVAPPRSVDTRGYPGFPLVASSPLATIWFFGALPLLTVACWWWSRRPPAVAYLTMETRHEQN